MNRRALLGGAAAVTAGTAGCLTRLFEDGPEGVVLGPQADQIAESDALSYPAYGQSMPTISLPDPVGGITVDTEDLDRTAVYTTFFASCPAECGILMGRLSAVQELVAERGLTEKTAFLPITFDPDRDDADALRENADIYGVDLEAGNWHYLRPEDPDEANRVVTEEFGLEFERDTGSDRLPGYDFTHVVLTTLVNPDGVVERAYRGENLDHDRVADDIETVVEAFADRE
ncbi:protein SCO1/2 [Halorubrum alkaliphilum]|uniref:Protein SCO1/2 n=1 Tax=Halorubrum alkaliphilum TaxID=261290 RepID=A0A8T4GF63_9EURY|nr:SCO family protein [Halorubrum alkaliphilum]MBP1922379.1 protein SCO1/2 [Halorubrum alkaliphilum]